jgi:hypothetical protein
MRFVHNSAVENPDYVGLSFWTENVNFEEQKF